MKKIFALPLLLGLFAGTDFAQNQKENSTRSIQNAPIYEYKKLIQLRDNLWMQFEIFAKNNSVVETIYILPENLKIKLREDGLEITTLDADFSDNTSVFAFAVTLLVPDNQDLDGWNGYLAELKQKLRARGALENARLDFVNGIGGTVIITTRIKNADYCKDPDWREYICEVRINLQNIAIKLDPNLKNNEPIIEIEWGLCYVVRRQLNFNSANDYVKAPQLVIYVKNETLLEEWSNRVSDWQNKIKPHRVPPPENSE